MNNPTFKEQQIFNDRLVFALLSSGIVLASVVFYQSVNDGAFQALHAGAFVLIILCLLTCYWWLRQLRLKVSINHERIKYKMLPLHQKAQRIYWSDVKSCELIQTPKIAQWCGRNVHFGTSSQYSLAGKNGLNIETNDGKKLFIGCKNMDSLKRFFAQLDASDL